MAATEVLRYAAFTDRPSGGNPAGVVLEAGSMAEDDMQRVATEVGYSETAFLRRRQWDDGPAREYDVRYFSPLAEVPFCGHATIGAAVAVAEHDRPGSLLFHTRSGAVPVQTMVDADGAMTATLRSVAPAVHAVSESDVAIAVAALGWSQRDLDPELPPRVVFAGARHLVLAAASRQRLATLDYDFEALRELCVRLELTTVDLVWRESTDVFHARNPFPVGGVVEDPATGAAAAALGAYLRELHLVPPTARLTIHQGEDMGRPSLIGVHLVEGRPEVEVTGSAVAIPAAILSR